MEAPGVRLRGLALVVEKDAGPRLALRYDPCPDCDEGRLFRDLSPTDLAKLFSQPRAKTDQLVEVQLDGLLVVSCPAEVGDVAENEDEVVWGEVDVAADAAAPPPPRLKRFDVLWAATAARAGDLNNAWTLESLERAAKDVRAALRTRSGAAATSRCEKGDARRGRLFDRSFKKSVVAGAGAFTSTGRRDGARRRGRQI